MGWRDKAKEALDRQHDRHNRHSRREDAPNVPKVPNVPVSPARALGLWHDKLSTLDAEAPPDWINRQAWAQLCLDSWWIYEAHASYAVRNGWTAQSLFGVDSKDPSAGGLAQLLRSSRSVVFDGPRAKVRSWGLTLDRNATWAADCPLIWDLG